MRILTIALLAAMVAGCGPGTSAILGGVVASSDDDDGGGKGRRPRPEDPPTGQPDTSFGLAGSVLRGDPAGPGGWAEGHGVTVDAFGRILVSGVTRSPGGNADMIVWRFNGDGTADLTFGGQGWVTHDNAAGGSGSDSGLGGVGVDSLGRIVVAGRSHGSAGNADVAVWRFLDSGILDVGFGGTGYVTFDRIADSGPDIAHDMVILPDDKILVAGEADGINNSDIFLMRLETGGDLDQIFGAGGVTAHGDLAGVWVSDRALGMVVDAEDRIILSGYSEQFLAVWRFTPEGGLDPTFGTDGYFLLDQTVSWILGHEGEAVTMATDGGILVAGAANTPLGNDDMLLWRLVEDGGLDLSFLGKGFVAYHGGGPGPGGDRAYDIVVDPAGGMVLAGFIRGPTDLDMAILRYHEDGSPDADFGTNGAIIESDTAGGPGNDQGRAIAIDEEGRILVTGWSANSGGTDDMVLWRYE